MNPENCTFPETPPVGIVLLRGIHGGYSIISISEPTGRPLYATQDLTDALAWIGASFSADDEEGDSEASEDDIEDAMIQEREMLEQRYPMPDMGSVGKTTPYQPANTCIKPGCKVMSAQGCQDPSCPFNFRNFPQNLSTVEQSN